MRAPPRLRRLSALVLAAAFLFALTQIPYSTIRQERIRAFGERTVPAVVEQKARRDGTLLLTYSYRTDDGRVRRRTAPFPRPFWDRIRPGQPLEVYVAVGAPNLSRAREETEEPFRVWLRTTVRGKELPEHGFEPPR